MRNSLPRLLRRAFLRTERLHTARNIFVALIFAAFGVFIKKTWSKRLSMREAEQTSEREPEAASGSQQTSAQTTASDTSLHQTIVLSATSFDSTFSAPTIVSSETIGFNRNPYAEAPGSHVMPLESRCSISRDTSGVLSFIYIAFVCFSGHQV